MALAHAQERRAHLTLGSQIKRYRERRGLGLNELSRLAVVRAATLSNLETEKRNDALVRTLEKLARALGVTVNDFLAEEPSDQDQRASPHVCRVWETVRA